MGCDFRLGGLATRFLLGSLSNGVFSLLFGRSFGRQSAGNRRLATKSFIILIRFVLAIRFIRYRCAKQRRSWVAWLPNSVRACALEVSLFLDTPVAHSLYVPIERVNVDSSTVFVIPGTASFSPSHVPEKKIV